MINKITTLIVALFSIIFFSYRKGKKDSKSNQIRDLVEFYEIRRKKNRQFSKNITAADREQLRKKWSDKDDR